MYIDRVIYLQYQSKKPLLNYPESPQTLKVCIKSLSRNNRLDNYSASRMYHSKSQGGSFILSTDIQRYEICESHELILLFFGNNKFTVCSLNFTLRLTILTKKYFLNIT